ncbi:MAG: hypothetical protein QHJ81_09280 [Anaerolineae bacterium]|nr:hypothetical protein [Anaerolineae bacterium]
MNLSTEDTQLFYKLRWALLAYANRHLKVIPQATTAEKVGKQPVALLARLRDALHAKPELLEGFVAENPERLSPQELAIVASWRHCVSGDFYIMRHLKPYTVFMSGKGPAHLYGVLGLYDPLEAVTGGAPLPILVQATLLPFRDHIIYDGILSFYRITFGRGIRTSLNQKYNRLKESEGIIEQLAGPTGEAQIRTSLDRKAPRKPAPDWRPVIDEIITQTEKMRQTDTKLQGAAFGLLRAAASLAQATLQEKDAEAETARRLRSVRTALTRLEKLLYAEEYM